MAIILVPLKDILTDPTNPADLAALPAAEASAAIRQLYAFLGDAITVTVANGIATLHIEEAQAARTARASQAFTEGNRLARKGQYRPAIARLEEGLRLLPADTDARRDLAMAQMAAGDYAGAKENLVRLLQLAPTDAQAFLLLGNVYALGEQDWGSAERYYASAYDLAPDDPAILSSYGGLCLRRGEYTQAVALLTRAVALAPAIPNAAYGLASAQAQQGDLDRALATLHQLFAQPASGDPRHAPAMAEARRLALALHKERAEQQEQAALAALAAEFAAYTTATGIGVQIQEEPSLPTPARVEMAWRYGRPYHAIKTAGGGCICSCA